MAATNYISYFTSNFRCLLLYQSQIYRPMFYFCFFLFFFFTFALFVSSVSLYKRLKRIQKQTQETQLTQKPKQSDSDPLGFENSVSESVDRNHRAFENDPTHSARSLLLEILPSDSRKWGSLFENDGSGGPDSDGPGVLDRESSESGGDQRGKKKKKRTKKKSSFLKGDENGDKGPGSGDKQDLVCLYPFTSSSSATQRKIKQQYDQLMKCHESKGLTLAQVFCLVSKCYASF